MLKSIVISMCVTMSLWAFSAQAEEAQVIESCEITSAQAFSKTTIIECDGDLKIRDSLLIEDGSLHLLASGQVFFGEKAQIFSNAKGAEAIHIYARTARGQLTVNSAVDVNMEFASVAGDYQQSITTQYGASVNTVVSSQKLLLEGPENKISR